MEIEAANKKNEIISNQPAAGEVEIRPKAKEHLKKAQRELIEIN